MKRILVVDDEKLIRQGLVAMLNRAKTPIQEVLTARDGASALEILKSTEIDLLITDIRMPDLDGMALVSHSKKLANPPQVIVISGYDDFHYAVEMLRYGVRDYLLKPIERDLLYKALEQVEADLQKKQEDDFEQSQRASLALLHKMISRNPEEAACDKIIEESFPQFGNQPYLLVCTREALPEDSGILSVTEFEKRRIYVVFGENKGEGVKYKLKEGRHIAGISQSYMGLENLRKAYNEGILQWKISFFCERAEVANRQPAFSENEVNLDVLLRQMEIGSWQQALRILKQQGQSVGQKKVSPDAFGEVCYGFVNRTKEIYCGLLQVEEGGEAFCNLWMYQDFRHYMSELESWLVLYGEQIQKEFTEYENKKKVWQAVQYVRENYRAPLNMAVVSNHVSMNYSLFSLLFKQYTGVNFVSFLQNIRLEEAKRLLAETDLRAYEIASRCGFQDDKHFLKVFKGAVGVSTSEWRKLNAGKE